MSDAIQPYLEKVYIENARTDFRNRTRIILDEIIMSMTDLIREADELALDDYKTQLEELTRNVEVHIEALYGRDINV